MRLGNEGSHKSECNLASERGPGERGEHGRMGSELSLGKKTLGSLMGKGSKENLEWSVWVWEAPGLVCEGSKRIEGRSLGSEGSPEDCRNRERVERGERSEPGGASGLG